MDGQSCSRQQIVPSMAAAKFPEKAGCPFRMVFAPMHFVPLATFFDAQARGQHHKEKLNFFYALSKEQTRCTSETSSG